VKDDLLTIEELLYGMMLPSGNDAAVALAMYFGSLLITKGQIDPNTHLTEINENVV
jgi:D-alanyl-D-alanine carboxypeptidase